MDYVTQRKKSAIIMGAFRRGNNEKLEIIISIPKISTFM